MRDRLAFAWREGWQWRVSGLDDAWQKAEPRRSEAILQRFPDDQKIPARLNRLTFGPRPATTGVVQSLCLTKWLDRNCIPKRSKRIRCSSRTDNYLDHARDEQHGHSSATYPTPRFAKAQMVDGRLPFPTDRASDPCSPKWWRSTREAGQAAAIRKRRRIRTCRR